MSQHFPVFKAKSVWLREQSARKAALVHVSGGRLSFEKFKGQPWSFLSLSPFGAGRMEVALGPGERVCLGGCGGDFHAGEALDRAARIFGLECLSSTHKGREGRKEQREGGGEERNFSTPFGKTEKYFSHNTKLSLVS